MNRRAFLTFSSLSLASLVAGCGGGGESDPSPEPCLSGCEGGGGESDVPPEPGFGVFRSELFNFGVGVTLVGVLPGGDFVVRKTGTRGYTLPGVIRRGSDVFNPLRFVNPDGGDAFEYTLPIDDPLSVASNGKVLLSLRSLKSSPRFFIVDPLQGDIPPESEIVLPRSGERFLLAPDDTIYGYGSRYRRPVSGAWPTESLDTNFQRWGGSSVEQFGVLIGKTVTRFAQAAYMKDGMLSVLPRPFPERYCEALDYRSDGAIIGRSVDDEGFQRGILWNGGSVTDLGRNFIPRFFSANGAVLGDAPGTIGLNPTDWVSPRVVRDGVVAPYRISGPAASLTKRFPVLSLPDGTLYIIGERYGGFEAQVRANTYYELKPTWV